jgi:hypothetical protein
MRVVNPMFHENTAGMWCWFATDAHGCLLSVSAQAFFTYEEARRDFDYVQRGFTLH